MQVFLAFQLLSNIDKLENCSDLQSFRRYLGRNRHGGFRRWLGRMVLFFGNEHPQNQINQNLSTGITPESKKTMSKARELALANSIRTNNNVNLSKAKVLQQGPNAWPVVNLVSCSALYARFHYAQDLVAFFFTKQYVVIVDASTSNATLWIIRRAHATKQNLSSATISLRSVQQTQHLMSRQIMRVQREEERWNIHWSCKINNHLYNIIVII